MAGIVYGPDGAVTVQVPAAALGVQGLATAHPPITFVCPACAGRFDYDALIAHGEACLRAHGMWDDPTVGPTPA